AASARLAAPMRRTRSFSRQAPGRNIRRPDGRCVARLITAAWRATARRSASGAKRSTSTGTAPVRSSAARLSAVRPIALTWCPAATSSRSARRPMTPVAPARKIRTSGLRRVDRRFARQQGRFLHRLVQTDGDAVPRVHDGDGIGELDDFLLVEVLPERLEVRLGRMGFADVRDAVRPLKRGPLALAEERRLAPRDEAVQTLQVLAH